MLWYSLENKQLFSHPVSFAIRAYLHRVDADQRSKPAILPVGSVDYDVNRPVAARHRKYQGLAAIFAHEPERGLHATSPPEQSRATVLFLAWSRDSAREARETPRSGRLNAG
jgi:hypothetical protein